MNLFPHELMPFVSLLPEPCVEVIPAKYKLGQVVQIKGICGRVTGVKESKEGGYRYCILTSCGNMCLNDYEL